jgi:hypothetical protein
VGDAFASFLHGFATAVDRAADAAAMRNAPAAFLRLLLAANGRTTLSFLLTIELLLTCGHGN